MMRFLLERLARGKTLRRHLPARFDRKPIIVSPDAQLKHLMPGESAFDPMLLDFAWNHVRSGHSVWDIGANVGVFSLAAAIRGGSVLAVEPDLWLAQLIQKTAALPANRHLDLQVLAAAVADRPGVSHLAIASRGRASNHLQSTSGRTPSGGERLVYPVPVLTLDGLLDTFRPPAIVKIDVEGAEALVLRGAPRLLGEIRPLIHVEVGSEARDEVGRLLVAAGYQFFDGYLPLAGQSPISTPTFNLLAVPRDWSERSIAGIAAR